MKLSRHAQKRGSQRGIKIECIEVLKEFGIPYRRPGGATEYRITKKRKAELTSGLKRKIQALDKIIGKAILIGEDGTIITMYTIR